jgi:hypothetical protein
MAIIENGNGHLITKGNPRKGISQQPTKILKRNMAGYSSREEEAKTVPLSSNPHWELPHNGKTMNHEDSDPI